MWLCYVCYFTMHVCIHTHTRTHAYKMGKTLISAYYRALYE